MEAVKYKDAKPITHRVCTAWEIKLPDGRTLLHLWHPDAELPEVHHSCSVHYKEFILRAVQVGDYEVEVENQVYLPDGRGVDQDWNIRLD